MGLNFCRSQHVRSSFFFIYHNIYQILHLSFGTCYEIVIKYVCVYLILICKIYFKMSSHLNYLMICYRHVRLY